MTRVLEYGNEDNYKTDGSLRETWAVYRRLLGYAFGYKRQLAIVVVFSLVIAGSFTTVIFSVGTGLALLYQDPADPKSIAVDISEGLMDREEDDEGNPTFWANFDLGGRFQSTLDWAHLNERNKTKGLALLCVLLVALMFIGGLARFLQEYMAGVIGAGISVRLNEEMFGNVIEQSNRFFDSHTTGEVVARFTNDAFMVNKGLASVFVKIVREPIKATVYLTIALSISWSLTLVVLVVMPLVGVVIARVGKTVKKNARRSLQKVAAMASVIHETVQGITIIKSFRMEEYEKARISREVKKLRKHLVRMARADAMVGPTTELIMVLGLVTLMMLGHREVMLSGQDPESGHLNIVELLSLFTFLAMMLDPLRKLATVNNMVQTSVASAERVFEFIDARSEVVEAEDAVDLPPLRDSIRFETIDFSYNGDAQVLDGLDFEIKKGEMVALVGFSGAGKSTVAKLIPRFYDPTGGRVTIDGVDIRDATLASLRDQISVVTQDTILFHETIRNNIAFGNADYSDERVGAAAAAANATSFIEALPEGFDTPLDEGGGNLSGGQRQRLAIARAIIKDPSILILDEATSSLDSESEKAIQSAIEKFVVGRTTLVIAHRLSTIQRADRIIVIDEGRVAEEGPHEALLAKGGIYARLYDVQFSAGQEDAS
jgi:subfamily B ATP-binding cassette protein MsbA